MKRGLGNRVCPWRYGFARSGITWRARTSDNLWPNFSPMLLCKKWFRYWKPLNFPIRILLTLQRPLGLDCRERCLDAILVTVWLLTIMGAGRLGDGRIRWIPMIPHTKKLLDGEDHICWVERPWGTCLGAGDFTLGNPVCIYRSCGFHSARTLLSSSNSILIHEINQLASSIFLWNTIDGRGLKGASHVITHSPVIWTPTVDWRACTLAK